MWERVSPLFRSLFLAVGLILLMTYGAHAQTVLLTGSITDEQGGAVGGVTITVTSTISLTPVVVVSEVDGSYLIPTLVPDTYSVTFELDGFDTQQFNAVKLTERRRHVLDVVLALSSFNDRIDVVGVTPMLGGGIPRDRVASTVSVVNPDALAATAVSSTANTLNQRLGSVSLEGATTNPFQPTLRFRGFTASPLLGLPQGIVVYQNGVRINESFGDTVQFDLIPQFAIDQIQLSAGASPTYGLNALGGALALRLKNGFDQNGFRGKLSLGSHDQLNGTAEFGTRLNSFALYAGTSRFKESGWRRASQSDVTQAVVDVGYREGILDAGLSYTHAKTKLNGNGAAPVELLNVDRSAVYTFPDTTRNELAFTQGRLSVALSPTWSLDATGYYRDMVRHTLNADEFELALCDSSSLPVGHPTNALCASSHLDGGLDGESLVVDVLTGALITQSEALGDGALNRTSTSADSYGGTVQTTSRAALGSHDNFLIFGASIDLADVRFGSNSEVGTMTSERSVVGSGMLAGIAGRAPDDRFNTELTTANQTLGLYFSDTFSAIDRAHLTVSGRYNWTQVDIADQLGTSLNGTHVFRRFNPGIGGVYQVSDAVAVFGQYAESSRAPVAAELSCADPAEPCRIPNAFVSDPPLRQAIGRSFEGGLRGRLGVRNRAFEWSVATYRTRIADDILFVASPRRIGTGFFQNAGDTKRLGFDIDFSGEVADLGWYGSYGFVDASFESVLALPGNQEVNDAATETGEVHVTPGDRLPGIPRHSFKAGVQQEWSESWYVSLEAIIESNRIFVGDEGNDQRALNGYGILNFYTSYRLGRPVELFVRMDNLLNRQYETFGVLAEADIALKEVPGASDPRFVGPAPPRTLIAGMQFNF